MTYYKSKVTNKIVCDNVKFSIDSVYGYGTFDDLVEKGLLYEVSEPTVEDILEHGTNAAASYRYRELHSECSSYKEAKEALNKIRETLKKGNKNEDRKQ